MEIISGFVQTTHQQILWWRGFYLTILMGVLAYYYYFCYLKLDITATIKRKLSKHVYALILVLMVIFFCMEFVYQEWQTQKLNRLCLLDLKINEQILETKLDRPIYVYRTHNALGTLLSPSFSGFYVLLNLPIFLYLAWIEPDP